MFVNCSLIPNMDAQMRAQQKVRSFHSEFWIVIWKLSRSTAGLSSTSQYLVFYTMSNIWWIVLSLDLWTILTWLFFFHSKPYKTEGLSCIYLYHDLLHIVCKLWFGKRNIKLIITFSVIVMHFSPHSTSLKKRLSICMHWLSKPYAISGTLIDDVTIQLGGLDSILSSNSKISLFKNLTLLKPR